MKFPLRFFYLFSFVISFEFSEAQNFNYSLSKDSSSYQSLASPTVIAEQKDWTNKKFSFNLPFQFNCAGTLTDSVTIESNGFVSFGANTSLALVAFNNFSSGKDTSENFVSSISTQCTGATGNRVFKIEFKNLVVNTYSSWDYLNYQLWFHETSNKITCQIGPNAYSYMVPDSLHPENYFPELVGLINRKMNSEINGYLVTGFSYSPTGVQLGMSDLLYINNMPGEGTAYTFTPLF